MMILKQLVIQDIWSQKKKKMKTLTKILTMMKHLPTQRLEFLFYAIFQAPKNQRVLFKFWNLFKYSVVQIRAVLP